MYYFPFGVYWQFFGLITSLKLLLMPAYHSTDFEVHRNWLAITHSLPLNRWYYDATSNWTLDYPPFFAYFEWLLSQIAKYVDPKMLSIHNHNYDTEPTVWFQRGSVIVTDFVFAWGVLRCLSALKMPKDSWPRRATEVVLLWNVGLLFIDHIHFQYNGFLFGMLLLSISYLLEERFLVAAFIFASLLNFKHIFLYVAPAFAVYMWKFYCWDKRGGGEGIKNFGKLLLVGLIPFVLSFGPFHDHLPQVFSRLFPFKRGLTHSYWAPNIWPIYNILDKVAGYVLGVKRSGDSNTSGLVQEYEHVALPTVRPLATFLLTLLFMLPCLVKLGLYTEKSARHKTFVRSVGICACTAFMFGWHVHEKAILMTMIPLSLISMMDKTEAKFNYILSFPALFSLFPLLHQFDLWLIRYSLFMFHVTGVYTLIKLLFKGPPTLHLYENVYVYGFIAIPVYDHVINLLFRLHERWPFMPLLLTSLYCSIGIIYFYITYYIHMLELDTSTKPKSYAMFKSKSQEKKAKKAKKAKKVKTK